MFAVLFEVAPRPERWEEYLGYAARLKPELERIDGFMANERFASRRREGWLISLSIWRDEKALIRWRTHPGHHAIQGKGRSVVFRDYHLRVGEIVTDTEADGQLPQTRFDATEAGPAKLAVVSELPPGTVVADPSGPLEWDRFESITAPGKTLLLSFWPDAAAAGPWLAAAPAAARHRTVRIIRNYGMFERAEAPQYHPAAQH